MATVLIQLMFSSTVNGLRLGTAEVDEAFWSTLSDQEKEAYLAGQAQQFARQFANWRAAALTNNQLAALAE